MRRLSGGRGARDALRDVHCSALVVHERDDLIPLESSRAVVAGLWIELGVLDDGGYVPYVEQPEARFRAIRNFPDCTSPERS